MGLDVGQMVSALRRMTVGELKEKYGEVFGEPTRSNHKDFLFRRIAWRMQALEEGGLPERARERALEIATDTDLRIRPPRRHAASFAPPDTSVIKAALPLLASPADRLPMPGALVTRVYKGRTIHVRVLPKGFDDEATVYRSLSAVAKAVSRPASGMRRSKTPSRSHVWNQRCTALLDPNSRGRSFHLAPLSRTQNAPRSASL